ncbi:MAG: aconitase family protein, partial [Paraglaciecola chathamensis]
MSNIMDKTLFEKIWQHHLVQELDDGAALIYIDRVFLHERTGSIALKSLEADKRKVVSPEHVFC